jgi:hypothetical protein
VNTPLPLDHLAAACSHGPCASSFGAAICRDHASITYVRYAYAERAIGSVRRELLRHIRVADAFELQFYLDEYRRYANTERPHQGIEGQTPQEASTEAPEAAVLDLAEARRRRLVRRNYAHGLLVGYSLEPESSETVTTKHAV